jgi:hypothetical protein
MAYVRFDSYEAQRIETQERTTEWVHSHGERSRREWGRILSTTGGA